MKKLFALTMAALLVAALVAGCGSASAGKVKTGLAIVTSVSGSKDAAADTAGLAQGYSTIAAVTVDDAGKIVACVIDAAQTNVNFDATGVVTTPLDSTFQTKNELKEGYGMKSASSIGKEWYEQAAAFAAYVVGKTAAEVQGIAVAEDGHAADADLLASVTVHVTDFIKVVSQAAANAAELGATASDTLSVGTVTSISGSKNAAADAEGLVQVYNIYAAITRGGDKITSCVIDATQAKVNFDATGKITTDLTAPIQSKDELKEGYGMKSASSIGKEWYEQAAAFAAYVTGKTPTEVAGIALDAEGHATAADITASVTVHVTDFLGAIAKAAK
ncbi:MAG: hypothetical protein ABFC62_04200 [Clostridiaceae bacterium]|nr:hypothetical protein [Eubacteriales bacterium]